MRAREEEGVAEDAEAMAARQEDIAASMTANRQHVPQVLRHTLQRLQTCNLSENSSIRGLFVVSQFVTDLRLPLSQVRLETYRPQNGSDLEMLTNYFWNIDLAEALVPSLHAAELAIRNSVHAALTNQYGTEMWFYERDLLEPGQLGQFAQALGKVAKKPHPRAGRLVAELSFGFWVTLLSAPYEQRIWQPNNYALLATVFPHVGSFSRKQVADRFNDIRILRNRVFHYEAVWSRTNLLREHTKSMKLSAGSVRRSTNPSWQLTTFLLCSKAGRRWRPGSNSTLVFHSCTATITSRPTGLSMTGGGTSQIAVLWCLCNAAFRGLQRAGGEVQP